MNKKIKVAEITAAILCSISMPPTAVAQDDLLQDAGSWLQVVGEGSLKTVDPSLEKVVSGWKDNPVGTITGVIGIKVWHVQRWVIHSVTVQRFGQVIPFCPHKTSARIM